MTTYQNSHKCFKGWSTDDGNLSGRCCCNCQYQVEIMRHPWNTISGGRMKGPVTATAGYGCSGVDPKKIIFFEKEHSMCELHEWKNTQEDGAA